MLGGRVTITRSSRPPARPAIFRRIAVLVPAWAVAAAVVVIPGGAVAGGGCSNSGPNVTWDGGGDGIQWGDGDNWAPNGVPGTDGTVDDYVCIPQGVQVKLNRDIDARVIGVDVEGTLTVTPGGKLFLHGPASSTATRFQLRAGTLGGRAAFRITRLFSWTALVQEGAATQTTRPLKRINDPLSGAPGRTIIGARAKMKVNGPFGHTYDPGSPQGTFGCGETDLCGGVQLRDKRIIKNRGTTVLTNAGYIAADRGTTFHNTRAGRFVFYNDRGYYEGFTQPEKRLSSFINAGAVVKASISLDDGPDSTSVIDAIYSEPAGRTPRTVQIYEGRLSLPAGSGAGLGLGTRAATVKPGAGFGTGTCANNDDECDEATPTTADKQTSAVSLAPGSRKAFIKIREERAGRSRRAGAAGASYELAGGGARYELVGEEVTVRLRMRKAQVGSPVTLLVTIDKSELDGETRPRRIKLFRSGERIAACRGPGVRPRPACVVRKWFTAEGDFRAIVRATQLLLINRETFTSRRYK